MTGFEGRTVHICGWTGGRRERGDSKEPQNIPCFPLLQIMLQGYFLYVSLCANGKCR